ncbi:MAG: UvrD-helicase domain-containing protein [Bacteroidales bacterium]|nr:UvrD-helicase domain-containing protein [Bacteroidales bacterium]
MKNFVVYKSSAGSGKTTTLAIEYLKLSLSKPENFKHILALTFTKDAANEMKDRILTYLIKIINYQEGQELDFIFDPLIASHKKSFSLQHNGQKDKAIEEIQKQAQLLLILILHNYSDFAISTIDSFTHRIIKSFAHDLGIAISFEVELETTNLLKTAVNDLINRAGEEYPTLTEVLLDFSLHKIGSDKSRKIDTDLRALAKNLLEDVKEEYLVDLRKLSIDDLLKIKEDVFAEITKFKAFVNRDAKKAVQLIESKNLDCTNFYYGKGNICNWFSKLAQPNFSDKEIKPGTRVLSSIYDDKWENGKNEDYENAKIEEIKEDLKSHFLGLMEFIDDNLDQYLTYQQISKHIYPLLVLNEIEKIVFQLKTESNVLHISDFNKLIAQAIAGEPAPFIYERIGNWYTHFLIDEFQDTSSLQWNNLLPLIENSLSENNYNLLVGDGKQSIYRWRGGEVKQFVQLPTLLNKKDQLSIDRERILKENYQETFLQVNYRSDENIVQFNNDFFQFIQQSNWLPTSAKRVYDQVVQTQAENKRGFGQVDIRLVEEQDEELEYKTVIAAIQSALDEGYNYSDITILVRKNGIAAAYADLLLEHNIPVISSVGLRVSSSAKVKFLLSFFHSLRYPDELVFQVEMIRFLLKDNRLGTYTWADFHQLVKDLSVSDKGISKRFYELLNQNGYQINPNELNQSDVYELAESVLKIFDILEPDPYIQFFLDALHEFKRSTYNQLSDFLVWWEEHKNELFIEMPNGLNAITIQTVFKAKGLQYPVVIYALFDKSLNTDTRSTKSWLNPGLEKFEQLKSFPFTISSLKETPFSNAYNEEKENQKLDDINLIYVALTRAKHRLYILSNTLKATKSKKNAETFYDSIKPSLLFSEYLADKQSYLIEDTIYRFGENLRKPDHTPVDETQFYYLNAFDGASWREHISLSNSPLDELNKDDAPALWGIAVHEVLAHIYRKEDVIKAINNALYSGLIKPEDQLKISDYIHQIVNHSLLSAFFEDGLSVANETDLIDAFGQFHRPDRLVFLKDKTVIIDYKTGKFVEKHKKQIREYAELLAQMSYPNPQSYLVYLQDQLEVYPVW